MTTPPTAAEWRTLLAELRATAALVRESTRLLRRTRGPAKPGATKDGGRVP